MLRSLPLTPLHAVTAVLGRGVDIMHASRCPMHVVMFRCSVLSAALSAALSAVLSALSWPGSGLQGRQSAPPKRLTRNISSTSPPPLSLSISLYARIRHRRLHRAGSALNLHHVAPCIVLIGLRTLALNLISCPLDCVPNRGIQLHGWQVHLCVRVAVRPGHA